MRSWLRRLFCGAGVELKRLKIMQYFLVGYTTMGTRAIHALLARLKVFLEAPKRRGVTGS